MLIDYKGKSAYYPMPVVVIATYNEDRTTNAMTVAWTTLEDRDEILLELSKDHLTVKNIEREKAFSVSIVDKNHIAQADYLGIVSGNEVKDKFYKTGLTSIESDKINAPIIIDFPVTMECIVKRIEDKSDLYLLVGKIVNVKMDENVLNEKGGLNIEKCHFVTFNEYDHSYREISSPVGKAFSDGLKYK